MTGQAQKELGQALAVAHNRLWADVMVAELRQFCARRKKEGRPVFRLEDFRVAAADAGLPLPMHHNAWGGLPKMAVRDGFIAWTGQHEQAKLHSAHARYVKVWMAL